MECVQGSVLRIVFESAESGFLVGRLRSEDTGDEVTFVGSMLAVSPGDTMRLWGRWEENSKFGRQLRVHRFETILPSTIDGIERYLGSGMIKGIGRVYAKRLVKAFGADTLRIINEEPEKLRNVAGIGRKRIHIIKEAWQEQRAIQSIMVFLQGHGIPIGQAVRIYKRYGDKAITVLRENPYRLAYEVSGIGFKTADAIAAEMGIPRDSAVRAEAGLRYSLDEASGEGHVYMPWLELRQQASALLGVKPEVLDAPLTSAVRSGGVIQDGEAIYLPYLHQAELGVCSLLKGLLQTPMDKVSIQTEKAIEWVEKTKGIALSEEQRQAIRMAIDSKVMVITGGPGTGKTTVLNGLLEIFDKKRLGILLAAPTGRAAKRMEAATGREAKTLHRLLEFSPINGRFTRDEQNPLDADLVVIDECSMVDISLMHHTLKAIAPNTRLFLVGDVDQLPSVGPGNVLLDVISSQAVPTIWLKTVFRQDAQSGIVLNAHRINQGQSPQFNTTDFFFVEREEPARAVDTILELVAERIPRKFGFDPKRDIQVLAPMRRGDAGVTALNAALKEALNPGAEPIARRPFGIGDKVMQQRNNYELDVYNGDIGVLTRVDEEMKEAQVRFDDREVIYPFDTLDELELAYAGTVHKAQGSEYPAVVMPMLTQHFVMLQRNILYTGVTRASKLVIIVGTPRAVDLAIRNTKVTRRNTGLVERLRTK